MFIMKASVIHSSRHGLHILSTVPKGQLSLLPFVGW